MYVCTHRYMNGRLWYKKQFLLNSISYFVVWSRPCDEFCVALKLPSEVGDWFRFSSWPSKSCERKNIIENCNKKVHLNTAWVSRAWNVHQPLARYLLGIDIGKRRHWENIQEDRVCDRKDSEFEVNFFMGNVTNFRSFNIFSCAFVFYARKLEQWKKKGYTYLITWLEEFKFCKNGE